MFSFRLIIILFLKMTAVSLDLPSNVLLLQTFRTVVPMDISAGERPAVVFCQIILASSSEKNCVCIRLFTLFIGYQEEREKTVMLKIKTFPRLLVHHFVREVKRCHICNMYIYSI